MDSDFAIALKKSVETLKSDKEKLLIEAMQKATEELKIGNSGDGDWERVRRAIFILENELKWNKEYSI